MNGRIVGLLVALALGGCATPYVQPPAVPPADFARPRIQAPALTGTPGAFVVQDGARLPFLRWGPTEPTAVVIALHGMNDHSAAFRMAGPWWAERGIVTYAYDQRGFGGAPGPGLWAGEATLTEDLRTVAALVRARHPGATIAVVGESMGGSVATVAFASDRPPIADQLILLAPGVWGWSSQSLVNRAGLWVAARALGSRAVEPPEWAVRDIRATDNLTALVRNGNDPRFLRSTRFDALSGLVDLMETATRRLGEVRAPTALLYGAHDQIIEKGPMRRALERAGTGVNLRTAWYAEGWHLLNRDLGAQTVYRDVEALLRDPSGPLPSGAPEVVPMLERER